MKPNDSSSDSRPTQTNPHPRVVITQGEATVKKTPNKAWLSISTQTRNAKAEDARKESAKDMVALQADLRATGLSTDAIKTTSYTLTPELEWKDGKGTVKGYIVNNQIEIRIDDLNRLSNVIDTVNATRNTTLTISGLLFALKNQQAAETEAPKLAVHTALTRAQAIAQGAQLSLGEILRIEELNMGDVHRPEPFLMRTAIAKADDNVETPMTIEEIEVQVKVILTAELKPSQLPP